MYFIDYRIVYSKENRSFHYVNPNRFFLPFSIGQGTSKVSLVMPDFSFRINQQDLAWIKGEAGRKKLGKKEKDLFSSHVRYLQQLTMQNHSGLFPWNQFYDNFREIDFTQKYTEFSVPLKMKLNSNWPKLINDTIS